MKRVLILIGFLALAACKPATYLGPLDSPLGNWKETISKYYFNGEYVYESPGCTYSAISFYEDSLCCIEGIKGTFKWNYSSDSLIVDTTVWRVTELSGRMMNLDYLGVIKNIVSGISEDESTAEYEYNETAIYSNGSEYWYKDAEGVNIACFPIIGKASDGSDSTICWWNTRSDYYKPF